MADSTKMVSRLCRCCHGTGKEWFEGEARVETKVCPTCKGKGKTFLDCDLYSDWVTCSQCMGEKVIRADGKCLYHPRFVFYGVYSYSSEGEKYGNTPNCRYCGEPAPGYDEAVEKRKELKEKRKKEEEKAKEKKNEVSNLKKEVDMLKKQMAEMKKT